MAFIDALVQKGILNRYQVDPILEKAETLDGGLDEALIEAGIDEGAITEIKSEYYNLPVKIIDKDNLSYDVLKYVPEASARHYKFVPVGMDKEVLQIGMVNPDNMEAYNALQFIAAKNNVTFQTFVISLDDFKVVLEGYHSVNSQMDDVVEELESVEDFSGEPGETNTKQLIKDAEDGTAQKKIVEDAPVTKMVAVILRHATEGRASDIHIEGTSAKVKVRFRVDGNLHTSLLLPKAVHSGLVARVKILAKLKIDEKRRPQDGRFPAKIDGRKVDFRVSTFPTAHGEKVVIRILDPERGVKALEETGMASYHVEMVRKALTRPYGLILITGPTGSGKTTTLYSMLREIDREKKNVVSLEDPVEYMVDGMNQSQVRPEIGYSFANGLRSILRQDPDVIMVGEIRDKETAQLAIQAALTGHLVFSTLHTNNAVGVIPRLVDMGVDPYLIAPTLTLSIAQRLAKRMCDDAKQQVELDASIHQMIEKQFEDLPEEVTAGLDLSRPVYEIATSAECPSGTRGRVALYEMFEMDREIERVILEDPSEPALYDVLRRKGMLTMKEDALLKSMDGMVSFTEVNDL